MDKLIVQRVTKAAGGPAKLARELGVTCSAVVQWRQVPQRHVAVIERITGIPCWEIRPDVYAPGHRPAAAQG